MRLNLIMMMFCDNCEGQHFYKKTAFILGRIGHEITWTVWKCLECGLLKIIKKEPEEIKAEKN